VKRIATGGGRGHSDPAGRRPHARSFRKCTSDPFATVFTPLKSASEAKGHARIATEVKGGAPGGESRRSGIPVFRAVAQAIGGRSCDAEARDGARRRIHPRAGAAAPRAKLPRKRAWPSVQGTRFLVTQAPFLARRRRPRLDPDGAGSAGIEPERPPYTVREGWSRLSFVRDPDS
jgi:hypothetical protein